MSPTVHLIVKELSKKRTGSAKQFRPPSQASSSRSSVCSHPVPSAPRVGNSNGTPSSHSKSGHGGSHRHRRGEPGSHSTKPATGNDSDSDAAAEADVEADTTHDGDGADSVSVPGEDVTLSTPSDVDASDFMWYNIGFTVESGETLVIQGPSGVGKTTLLRAIAQLTDYDHGVIYLEPDNQRHGNDNDDENDQGEAGSGTAPDLSPQAMGVPQWRSRVMYVPQYPAIFPGSPLDFFFKIKQFSTHVAKPTWDDPVEIGNAWGLPEECWCSEWRNLSGGQAQRAALAIAVACKPDVLLLDEPTSALDPTSAREVERTLRDYTCLWVTHDPNQAHRVGDRIMKLQLDAGCTIEPNTPRESNGSLTSQSDL
ncbi:hypothetical protein IWQ60_007367 [Tieghemiomyces parasiticus]|uniref:ABC transporter domain-containing protein n=1 Tax=Tieghemiomyces parasiticus TaxID=78921 RepID=A0A9W8DQS9_9FUNG|nr:hypothetical protein IWQ60_007367 [Tieghemiomyces parasiticus]